MSWLWGVLGGLAIPFAVTGIYRILPDSVPGGFWLSTPFVVLALVAGGLWLLPSVPRSISGGIRVGLVAWAAVLAWLIGSLAATPFD